MNNLKYYDDSLAYNFELFMPAKEKKAKIVDMPESPRAKAARKKASKNMVAKKTSVVIGTLLILGFLLFSLFLRSQVTETRAKIEKINNEITEATGEETQINIELEKKLSYKNLDSTAYAMGMRKAEKNQIVYIKANEKNKAETGSGVQFAENN